MKRQITTMAATGFAMLLGVVAMDGIMAMPARAEVNINVNIGAPPPVVVVERPHMLYLNEPAVYVAVGVPYDIFFVGGRYYRYHGDHWFYASGYNGPWVYVVDKSLPPGLRKYKVVQLREYREREYHVYKVEGSKFKGKHFDADPGPHHDDDHDRDHDRDDDHGKHSNSQGNQDDHGDNGKGRGRGHN